MLTLHVAYLGFILGNTSGTLTLYRSKTLAFLCLVSKTRGKNETSRYKNVTIPNLTEIKIENINLFYFLSLFCGVEMATFSKYKLGKGLMLVLKTLKIQIQKNIEHKTKTKYKADNI